MWFTCHNCNGIGNRGGIPCNVCTPYNLYYNGVLTFYGHIWCDDNDIEPITPPTSP
jgi:hypothetical protein